MLMQCFGTLDEIGYLRAKENNYEYYSNLPDSNEYKSNGDRYPAMIKSEKKRLKKFFQKYPELYSIFEKGYNLSKENEALYKYGKNLEKIKLIHKNQTN